MFKSHHYLLATACVALMGAAAYAPSASAAGNCAGQTNCNGGPYKFGKNDVYGGGSSLVSPYWRQTADCEGLPADLIINTSPPTHVDETFFNYTGSPPQNCATDHLRNVTIWYIQTGSGTGIKGVYSHDPKQYGFVNAGATQYFPEVFYGLSDAGLASSDVTIYNSGGSTPEQGLYFATPGAQACNTGTGTQANPYSNPAQCYGPMVQFPFSVDPVALTYAPVYEQILNANNSVTSYKFNIQYPRSDNSGGLRLDQTTYCKIFNGQITNWNDPAIKADNGGVSLEDPNDPTSAGSWSVPLIPVGRSDSSGTTSIFTRHLAAACAAVPGNLYTTGATTLAGAGAGAIVGNTYNTSNPNFPGVDQTGKITIASGSSGVAQYVAFTATPTGSNSNCTVPAGALGCITQGRIAYIGPDYVLPYVLSTNTNSYGLNSATLKNLSNQWEEPTPAGASTAFAAVSPPQSNKNGTYNAGNTSFGYRNDPSAWVQGLAPSSLLANPTLKNSYPIVGSTNVLAYTCYARSQNRNTLVNMLNFVNNAKINVDNTGGILATAGLAPLPKAWATAIKQTFLSDPNGLGLEIEPVGTGTACKTSGVVGG
jgi:phosphate transport system substrate-binding protein